MEEEDTDRSELALPGHQLQLLKDAIYYSKQLVDNVRTVVVTMEQSTRRRPVCPITHNISSETEKTFILTIISRHCFLTASPQLAFSALTLLVGCQEGHPVRKI